MECVNGTEAVIQSDVEGLLVRWSSFRLQRVAGSGCLAGAGAGAGATRWACAALCRERAVRTGTEPRFALAGVRALLAVIGSEVSYVPFVEYN